MTGNEDVIRLEVMVNELEAVEVFDGIQELVQDAFLLCFGRAGLEPLRECLSVDPFLHDAPPHAVNLL